MSNILLVYNSIDTLTLFSLNLYRNKCFTLLNLKFFELVIRLLLMSLYVTRNINNNSKNNTNSQAFIHFIYFSYPLYQFHQLFYFFSLSTSPTLSIYLPNQPIYLTNLSTLFILAIKDFIIVSICFKTYISSLLSAKLMYYKFSIQYIIILT